MAIQVDPNRFRVRSEAKINIIAKAIGQMAALTYAGAAFVFLRYTHAFALDDQYAMFGALMFGGIASWLTIERRITKLEERFPLWDDD